MDADGYYFRDKRGRVRGPLTRFQYEAWSLRGEIAPGSKVWRQQAGITYTIAITRKFRWRKLWSAGAFGALTEWMAVASTLGSLLFLASLPKLRSELAAELDGHVGTTLLMLILLVITVAMTVAALRKLLGRVTAETTEMCESEV